MVLAGGQLVISEVLLKRLTAGREEGGLSASTTARRDNLEMIKIALARVYRLTSLVRKRPPPMGPP